MTYRLGALRQRLCPLGSSLIKESWLIKKNFSAYLGILKAYEVIAAGVLYKPSCALQVLIVHVTKSCSLNSF